jgi:hypothetical protein
MPYERNTTHRLKSPPELRDLRDEINRISYDEARDRAHEIEMAPAKYIDVDSVPDTRCDGPRVTQALVERDYASYRAFAFKVLKLVGLEPRP